MGNLCFGKKKPKKPQKPSQPPSDPQKSNPNKPQQPANNINDPNMNKDPTDSPAPEKITSNIERVNHTSKELPTIKQDSDNRQMRISEKETNLTKNDYSFAKVTRTGDNKFSFEVYGEDISALNPKFLLDNLGNISHTSKINISRNDLLLLTEENQEILKFLSANNITHKDLIQGIRKEHAPGTIALDEKLRITGTMIQSNFPISHLFIRLSYTIMVY
jgi:hypothetical protein